MGKISKSTAFSNANKINLSIKIDILKIKKKNIILFARITLNFLNWIRFDNKKKK